MSSVEQTQTKKLPRDRIMYKKLHRDSIFFLKESEVTIDFLLAIALLSVFKIFNVA